MLSDKIAFIRKKCLFDKCIVIEKNILKYVIFKEVIFQKIKTIVGNKHVKKEMKSFSLHLPLPFQETMLLLYNKYIN
jgi:hypothetical protein